MGCLPFATSSTQATTSMWATVAMCFVSNPMEQFNNWEMLVSEEVHQPHASVIGNHDLPFLRKLVLQKLGLERGYYDFAVGKTWR